MAEEVGARRLGDATMVHVKTLFNTLRMGAFKLFKCTFPGSKQFKSTFILCSLKIHNKFANYFCELKFSGNTHQRP